MQGWLCHLETARATYHSLSCLDTCWSPRMSPRGPGEGSLGWASLCVVWLLCVWLSRMPDHSQPKEGCAIVHRRRAQSAAGATAPHTYHCQVPGCKWRGFTQSAAWNHARRSHEQLEYVLWWELTSAETRREQNRRSQAKKRAAHQEVGNAVGREYGALLATVWLDSVRRATVGGQRARGEQQEALSVLALCLLETAGGGAVGLATSCYIMTRAGGGRRLIKGHVEPGLVEHAEVALSFAYASLSHGPLGRWLVAVPESTSTATAAASSSSSSSSAEPALAPEARRALTPQRQDEDVVVYHAEARVRKDGGSAGAAMALLAVCRVRLAGVAAQQRPACWVQVMGLS